MDRIAEILADAAAATKGSSTLLAEGIALPTSPPGVGGVPSELGVTAPPVTVAANDAAVLRRPHLGNLNSLRSMQQLQPFFSRASIDTFEGVYAAAGVDWESVEAGLISEIFGDDSSPLYTTS